VRVSAGAQELTYREALGRFLDQIGYGLRLRHVDCMTALRPPRQSSLHALTWRAAREAESSDRPSQPSTSSAS